MKKKIKKRFFLKKKIRLVILIMTIALLQSTISIPSLKTLGVGTEAPNFSLQDFSGKGQNFSSLKGDKLTVLLFWATWGQNSVKALEQLEELHKKYQSNGLKVVGINVEKQHINSATMAAIKKFTGSLELTFPNLIDHGLVTFHEYGVIAVPTTVILDNDRKIKFEMSGMPMLGNEEMKRFLAAEIEGKAAPVQVAKAGYYPDKHAVRSWNMGVKALQSKRMAHTAEMWFNKAIAADPNFILPYLSLGNFLKEAGKGDAARKQFQKAIAIKPDYSPALGSLALLLIEDGSYSAARELLEKALKADEAYTPGYYYLAYLSGKEGNLEKAEELFGKAEAINPLDYRINVYRGKMFEDLNKLEPAAASYKKGLQQLLQLP